MSKKVRQWEKVVLSLVRFHFLTYKQIIKLGIGTTSSNLSPIMNDLVKSGLVHKWRQPTQEAFFYLSLKGGKRFGGKGRKLYKKKPIDIDHRLRTVDVEIMLAKHNLVSCEKYFDQGKVTSIPLLRRTFEPDLIGKILSSKQEELFLVEVELGLSKKKIQSKIELHELALRSGAVPKALKFTRGYRVLVITEGEAISRRVIEGLSVAVKRDFAENFLFSSDLATWRNLNFKVRQLYYS